jgi:aryl-alcohol dehydrogenase-like predicted oxidoreductase
VIALGPSGVEVSELCLGGNVFGWTADEPTSLQLLDAYVDWGGNFIDTADTYSQWQDGHVGGESETIIGRWLARRSRRDDVVLATKVGKLASAPGLSAANITAAADASLKRLGTDYIDLYYAHADDPTVPLEETLAAFDTLVAAGKVRLIGASNYNAPRLVEALNVSRSHRLASYTVLQTHYNLVHRHEYEDELAEACTREGLVCVAYSALADGFLTGKYRPGAALPSSERAEDASVYLTPQHERVLEALDQVAARHEAPVAAVALAWLSGPRGVVALASARTTDQLGSLLRSQSLRLSGDDVDLLESRTAELADV